jgi:hypothetical protein
MNGAIASTPKADSYDKWRAEDDLRTLTTAAQIRKDKKRMADVKRAAKEKLGEMAHLKSLANGEKGA